MKKSDQKIFRGFYNDVEEGGSSRWLVAPDTVEVFINGLLDRQKDEALGISSTQEFDIFYAAYPNKKAKVLALRSWQKLAVTTELFQKIMKSLDAHKVSQQWTKDSGMYIPHPSTWLNQRRWEDEVEVKGQGSTKYEHTHD